MNAKLRIAWFSDLPDDGSLRTVSAYVSSLVLPALRERFDIELFHNSFRGYQDYTVAHCLTALRRHREKPFDIFFYQLEDSPHTQWLRIHCALMPGVQYSHDYLFTTFGPEPILNSPWHSILTRLDEPVDSWPDRFAEQYQKGPHALRETAYAAVRLFSQPGMVSECRRLSERSVVSDGAVSTAYLPLPVAEEAFSPAPEQGRRILFCGSPWVQDRAHKLCNAIARYDTALPLIWLLNSTERASAEELVREHGLVDVTFVEDRTVCRWQELVQAGGLAIHTLFSVFSQTGPYLPVSFAAGLPCVVTRFGHSELLPDSVVFKVQAGETEAAELAGVFARVFDDGVRPAAKLVSSFGQELHAVGVIAEELALIFETQAATVRATMDRWETLKASAREALLSEARASRAPGPELVAESELFESVFREFGWV